MTQMAWWLRGSMCQLRRELPPEEARCAWLGTIAESWGIWSYTLDLTTKLTGRLCWDLCPCCISPLSGCCDTFWGLVASRWYWCSVPGWAAVSLAGVTGCQFTVAWWSQQWPPEGNNCVVINVIISLSCTAFCFAPCVNVWMHIWCNYYNKHIFDFDFDWNLGKYD